MKQFLLKTTFILLVIFSAKTICAQTINANFGYTVNCRTITPTDSSTGPNLFYIWEFGDGYMDYYKNTSHTYSINGSYQVTLIVICHDSFSGNFLKRDTLSRQITINCNACNMKTDFSYQRDQSLNKKIVFTNQTIGQTSYTSVWDFGDGDTSHGKHPIHTFPSAGTYYVSLKTSYYDAGLGKTCRDSVIKPVQVNLLKANFGYSIDTVKCTTVTFTDSSSGGATNYYWEFGDNGGSTNKTPTHTYSIGNGTSTQYFYVRLRIYLMDSSSSTYYSDTIIKMITLAPCNICQITANIYMGGDSTIPWQGVLYNYSTGMINKHYWNFGDGSSSTSASPVHTYAGPGRYTITYIAMDTIKNCRDTTSVSFTIDSAGYLKRKAFTLTVIDKTSTGITKKEVTEKVTLKVFPNPAQHYFNLTGTEQTIDIYDLKGMKMMRIPLKENEVLKISTDGWAKGLYIIRGTHTQYLKLLVE